MTDTLDSRTMAVVDGFGQLLSPLNSARVASAVMCIWKAA